MSKRAEFPKVCKRHGITVTIFKQERDGYSKYRVVYYEAGRRKEICWADYATALVEAELILDRSTNGSGGLLELKGTERLAWLRAGHSRVLRHVGGHSVRSVALAGVLRGDP